MADVDNLYRSFEGYFKLYFVMTYTDNLDANFGVIFKFLHMAMVGNLDINS